MSSWRVRGASVADEAALVRLEGLAFGAQSWGENNVKGSFVAPRVSVLLAEDEGGGSPRGFALWRNLGEEAELLTIGVDPNERRRGAASALLDACVAAAKAVHADRLFLEVDAGNAAAIGLYNRAGFAEIARRRAYYRNGADAIIMQLML